MSSSDRLTSCSRPESGELIHQEDALPGYLIQGAGDAERWAEGVTVPALTPRSQDPCWLSGKDPGGLT